MSASEHSSGKKKYTQTHTWTFFTLWQLTTSNKVTTLLKYWFNIFKIDFFFAFILRLRYCTSSGCSNCQSCPHSFSCFISSVLNVNKIQMYCTICKLFIYIYACIVSDLITSILVFLGYMYCRLIQSSGWQSCTLSVLDTD